MDAFGLAAIGFASYVVFSSGVVISLEVRIVDES